MRSPPPVFGDVLELRDIEAAVWRALGVPADVALGILHHEITLFSGRSVGLMVLLASDAHAAQTVTVTVSSRDTGNTYEGIGAVSGGGSDVRPAARLRRAR